MAPDEPIELTAGILMDLVHAVERLERTERSALKAGILSAICAAWLESKYGPAFKAHADAEMARNGFPRKG